MILRDHTLTTRRDRPAQPRGPLKCDRKPLREEPGRPSVEALRRHYEALGVVGKQCGSRPRAR